MLKINPIKTKGIYDQKGLQVRKPDFFVSENPIKNTLKTDIFQKQANLENPLKTPSQNFFALNFTGLKKQNKYEQGKEIASDIKNSLDKNVGGVSGQAFKNAYNKITDKNVIPTMNAYNKISPNETLIGAICKERGNSYKTRIDAVRGITDRLVSLGEKAGVQTEHYKEHFDAELDKQFDTILPVKVKQLDKISGALAQAIENKNSLNQDEKTLLKNAKLNDTQTYTTEILTNSVKKARKSMEEQANYDGWSAKMGEQIRKLWHSENQKELVHDDINTFEKQVGDLNKLVGTKDYNKKFKEIFDVDYDPELIATYKQKEDKFMVASICAGVETNFKNSVKDLLDNKPLKDEYFYPTCMTTGTIPVLKERKSDKYERNINAFAEFVGKGNVEDGRKQIEKTMRDYKIKDNSSIDEKYAVLQKMANKYARRLHQNTQNATGKKDLAEMKREYDNSYYSAFGVKNDVAKRVEDYRASQMWSELLLQDGLLCAASIPFWICTAGTGFIPTLKIAALHSGADLLVYGSDRLSSKQGMTEKDIKEILKWSAVDGATAFANQMTYRGIEAITSPIAKMSGTAAKVTDFALCTASDVGIDCGFEYLATGKVTLQGAVYSVLFSTTGYIIDMKLDDVARKKMSKKA